ncbi:MAG: ABC transporter ATP-binding protein [Candidatus Methanomethylicia archaeon]
MSSYDIAVKVENLVVSYGSIMAVNGLTFQVRSGEVYGLLGPNGAGKTSTIKVLAGVLEPTSGYVEVFGYPISNEIAVKSLIGYVPESIVLLDSLTPREFFEFIASVRKLNSKVVNLRLSQLVSAFNLKEYFDTPIAALSMGTKQKVAVIAALLHDPPLLVLDEPLNGLDARSSRILKELILIHTRKGGAVILSTHIMEIAEKLCTRVGIINRGKLIGEGTIDELKKLVKSVEGSLEDVFLKVTEQENDLREIVKALERI